MIDFPNGNFYHIPDLGQLISSVKDHLYHFFPESDILCALSPFLSLSVFFSTLFLQSNLFSLSPFFML